MFSATTSVSFVFHHRSRRFHAKRNSLPLAHKKPAGHIDQNTCETKYDPSRSCFPTSRDTLMQRARYWQRHLDLDYVFCEPASLPSNELAFCCPALLATPHGSLGGTRERDKRRDGERWSGGAIEGASWIMMCDLQSHGQGILGQEKRKDIHGAFSHRVDRMEHNKLACKQTLAS